MTSSTAKALAASSLVAAAACSTAPRPPAVPPVIETYQPGEIIVPGRGTGVLTSRDGCVRMTLEAGHVLAVQFPPGTTYAAADGAIVMPNGQRLPFGKRLTLVSEAWPNATSAVPQCRGLPAIQVLHRKTQ